MTAPITARPIAPPTVRKNWIIDVAMPSSDRGTALCTAMSIGTIVRPMPMPPSSASRMATAWVSVGDQRLSSTKATVRHTMPLSTTMRYPIRSTRRALTTDIATQPNAKGINTQPAAVADMPPTSCRNKGHERDRAEHRHAREKAGGRPRPAPCGGRTCAAARSARRPGARRARTPPGPARPAPAGPGRRGRSTCRRGPPRARRAAARTPRPRTARARCSRSPGGRRVCSSTSTLAMMAMAIAPNGRLM